MMSPSIRDILMPAMKAARVAKVYYDGAFRTAIMAEPGRKVTFGVIMVPDGIKMIRLKNRDAESCPDVLLKGRVYPMRRAQKIFRNAARRGRASKKARALV